MSTRSMSVVRFAALMLALLAAALFASFAAPDRGEAQRAPKVQVDSELQNQVKSLGKGQQAVAIVTYDGAPTSSELRAVRRTGVAVHEYQELPMVAVQGTKAELKRVISLRGPVSVWSNKKLEYFMHESRPLIGADRVQNELGYTGEGVGVAVIDSGVDGTHEDVTFGQEMVQNVKILGAPNFFDDGPSPVAAYLENQPNTDTSSGHGTHVAGTVGSSGEASGGYYAGVAPETDLVGIGAGDTLFILYALEGFDYALANQDEYNIKVINNSWGTSGEFEENDPVNVASKEAHDRGITVAFAAGNEGPENDTMNPYAVAPWVIGVAAGDKQRQLADFSSRGRPGDSLYHPDITAPGARIASTRASTGATINALTAATDLRGCVPQQYLLKYTCASGTSMATPHVAGVAALMLDANEGLTPDQVLNTLTSTADPMSGYQQHEVGAGYLDAYGAVTSVAPAAQPAAAGSSGR